MALSIQVEAEDNAAPKLIFDLPRIVIGRGASSDVRLPDPSVSQRHATIRQRGTDYIVLDEGSSNGTFVGPVRLSKGAPRVLRNGDRVRLGRVWLLVGLEPAATSSTPAETRELALRLVAGSLQAEGQPSAPQVRVVAGPDTGAVLTLTEFQHAYTLGRNQGCDLQLTDEDLSRQHLQVRRVGAEILVRDLGSKNGSFLAGAALGKEARWVPGQTLQLGHTSLELHDPLHDVLLKIEGAQDELMDAPDAESRESALAAPAEEEPVLGLASGAARPAEVALEVPRGASKPAAKRSGWSGVDLLVALVALTVIGASVAGFFWLMGG